MKGTKLLFKQSLFIVFNLSLSKLLIELNTNRSYLLFFSKQTKYSKAPNLNLTLRLSIILVIALKVLTSPRFVELIRFRRPLISLVLLLILSYCTKVNAVYLFESISPESANIYEKAKTLNCLLLEKQVFKFL